MSKANDIWHRNQGVQATAAMLLKMVNGEIPATPRNLPESKELDQVIAFINNNK